MGRERQGWRRRFRSVLTGLLLSAALWGAHAAAAQEGDGKLFAEGRLTWAYDSNVFETVRAARRVADSFARVEAGLGLRDRGRETAPAGRPQFGLRWVADTYMRQRTESRQLLGAKLGWRWQGKKRRANVQWNGTRIERPAEPYRNVRRNDLVHTGQVPFTSRGRLGWSARLSRLDTEPGGAAARRAWGVGAEVQRAIARSHRLRLRIEAGETRFDEPALGAPEDGVSPELNEKHEDRDWLFGAGFTWSGRFLASASYGFRLIDSNSFGFSQHRHEVDLRASVLLPERFALHLIGVWQEPRYTEEDYAVYRPGEDPEDPDVGARNGVTLQLTRPLGGSFVGEARMGWQRNEARISGEYYEKTTLAIAIAYRGGA